MPKPSAPERAQPEQRSAQVPETAAGRRFDAVLAELFPEFSRSRLAEWIKSGDALLDGAQVRPREPVRGGAAVTLSVLLDTRTESEPPDIPLALLYEDADVFVIAKPAGLVVHRMEERCVGKGVDRTFSSRWSPCHSKKTIYSS